MRAGASSWLATELAVVHYSLLHVARGPFAGRAGDALHARQLCLRQLGGPVALGSV